MTASKRKKVMDSSFFDNEGDIIDRITREHEFLENQKDDLVLKIDNDVTDELTDLITLETEEESELFKNRAKKKDSPSTLNSKLREENNNRNDNETGPEAFENEEFQSAGILNDLIEYYNKTLYSSKKALKFLEDHGFTNPEIIKRFKTGFCNGSVLDKLGKKQKEVLQEKKFLHYVSQQEHFCSCLIFPVFDDAGLSAVYGLNIDTGNYVKPVYLGDNIPFLNPKTLKIYDEVIFAGSIIDLLSLTQTGFNNVICLR